MKKLLILFFAIFSLAVTQAIAQDPFGSVEGTINDQQGAIVQGATVTAKNVATNAARTAVTNANGQYRILQLQPGFYEISVTAANFKKSVLENIQVQVGQIASADLALEVGGQSETVTVTSSAEAQIERSDNTVSGVVNTVQIENLPLNGRNFLDLAQLQPGTEKVDGGSFDPTKANYTGVSVGGQAGRSTQITVDGGSVVDNVVGTTVQNFSQEIVQEFQIGLSNFSLSTGASGSGSVNIVSKSGSNQFRGNAFVYYRDDKFAAFPALRRLVAGEGIPPAAQTDKIPFDREQFGGTLGGPIKKDKLFFFASYERNNQDGSSLRNPTFAPTFAGFSANPFDETLFTSKVDWVVSEKANAFFRYSFNDNKQQGAFPLGSGIVPRDSASGIFQSNDQIVTNRSHGFASGLTYSFSPNISNNLVFNFSDFKNGIDPAVAGIPEIRLSFDPDFRTGTNAITPQTTLQRRYQLRDDLTLIKGSHTLSFGGNYERTAIGGSFTFANPVRIRLFTPTSRNTESDFLGAFVRDISMGIGNPNLPFNESGDTINHRISVYGGDTWKITPRFTFNYGLSYRLDSNLWNHDLGRPAIIAGLFDDGTAPAKRDNNNFAPRVGFAWDVAGNGKTVIRGGFGMYYDNTIDNLRLFERADLGPVGAEQFLVGTGLTSALLPGGDGRFNDGQITLAQMLALYPSVRADLESRITNCTLPTAIECTGNISGPIFASKFQVPYSLQYSIGVQRELPYNLLLQVDYNYRKGVHEVLTYDANQADSISGPRLSTFAGPVPYADSSGFSTYSALLARVDRRFRNGFQFTASYSLSRFKAFGGDTLGLGTASTNLNNLRQDFGPAGLDRTHRFVFSAIYELPFYKNDSNFFKKNVLGNWTVSVISTVFSGTPQSLFLPDSVDLSGTGTFTTYLPGTGPGSIGRKFKTVDDVNTVIRAYNQSLTAGATDPLGTPLSRLAELPAGTQIGSDSTISQDFRINKTINFNERIRISLIGEVFNLFNVANLGNIGDFVLPVEGTAPGDITTLRPTQRTNGVFGTGGPRSFQFGLRFGF